MIQSRIGNGKLWAPSINTTSNGSGCQVSTSAVRDGDGWLGLYDGSASLAENYEERCGLAHSTDLRRWERVSLDGPAIGTARGAGGVRYVEISPSGDVFYEYTRPDGAHELRVTHTD